MDSFTVSIHRSTQALSTPQQRQQRLPSLGALPTFLSHHPYYADIFKSPRAHVVTGSRGEAEARLREFDRNRRPLLAILSDSTAFRHLLLTPPELLAAEHNLSELEVAELLAWAGQRTCPLFDLSDAVSCGGVPQAVPRRVADLCGGTAMSAPIPTGLVRLDRHLLGGLRKHFIVELTGPAGCGKTTMAFQWVANAIHADDDTAVLWLHTCAAASFESQALALLYASANHAPSNRKGACGGTNTRSENELRTRFHSMAVMTNLETFHRLQIEFVAHHISTVNNTTARVRLVVLDSLTELVHRSHSGCVNADIVERQNTVVSLIQDLKQLAVAHDLCVLLLTHSSRTHQDGGKPTDDAPGEFGRMLYHAVNVRLRLREVMWPAPIHEQSGADNLPSQCPSCELGRELRVVKSPLCGPVCVHLRSDADSPNSLFGRVIEVNDEEEAILLEMSTAAVGLSEDLATAVDAADYQTVPTFVCT